jgi:hypothetical protein
MKQLRTVQMNCAVVGVVTNNFYSFDNRVFYHLYANGQMLLVTTPTTAGNFSC